MHALVSMVVVALVRIGGMLHVMASGKGALSCISTTAVASVASVLCLVLPHNNREYCLFLHT